ncbi:MAG: chloride channel protein [Ilumatobacteraceae bacterium]
MEFLGNRHRRRSSLAHRRAELKGIVRRSRSVILVSAAVGLLVGFGVWGLEYLVDSGLEYVRQRPLWMVAAAPAVGLVAANLILQLGQSVSAATSDEFLRSFHEPNSQLPLLPAMRRLAASVATIATGGSLGLEGPSMYGGSSVGAAMQRRFSKYFLGVDHRTMMIAGAAAGISAVFKTPVTGTVFAMEVPYRNDMARHMLLPALFSSATSYLVFASLTDTSPILLHDSLAGGSFSILDILGAIVIGAVSAVFARVFAKLIRFAKQAPRRRAPIRVGSSAVALAALVLASQTLVGSPLSIGGGYQVFREWLFIEPNLAVGVIMLLLVVRSLATAFTVYGGGAGGLFVPLVVNGGLVGRAIAEVLHPQQASLYTFLGVAAFLGAGYRVPLAAVVFVAESTGSPIYVVPALFAAVMADLVMGEQSITAYQRDPDEP